MEEGGWKSDKRAIRTEVAPRNTGHGCARNDMVSPCAAPTGLPSPFCSRSPTASPSAPLRVNAVGYVVASLRDSGRGQW